MEDIGQMLVIVAFVVAVFNFFEHIDARWIKLHDIYKSRKNSDLTKKIKKKNNNN